MLLLFFTVVDDVASAVDIVLLEYQQSIFNNTIT